MEKWIERHKNKLLFMLLAIMAWSCISVVKDGGAVIPRIENIEDEGKQLQHDIETLDQRVRSMEIYATEILRLKEHRHRYWDGKILDE